MSLRVKFAILLSFIGCAMVFAIVVSGWAYATMRSGVREPFRSMTGLLAVLGDAKKPLESQRTTLRKVDAAMAAAVSIPVACSSDIRIGCQTSSSSNAPGGHTPPVRELGEAPGVQRGQSTQHATIG